MLDVTFPFLTWDVVGAEERTTVAAEQMLHADVIVFVCGGHTLPVSVAALHQIAGRGAGSRIHC